MNRIITSSSVADFIFGSAFVLKFEKDTCEAGENVISVIAA